MCTVFTLGSGGLWPQCSPLLQCTNVSMHSKGVHTIYRSLCSHCDGGWCPQCSPLLQCTSVQCSHCDGGCWPQWSLHAPQSGLTATQRGGIPPLIIWSSYPSLLLCWQNILLLCYFVWLKLSFVLFLRFTDFNISVMGLVFLLWGLVKGQTFY